MNLRGDAPWLWALYACGTGLAIVYFSVAVISASLSETPPFTIFVVGLNQSIANFIDGFSYILPDVLIHAFPSENEDLQHIRKLVEFLSYSSILLISSLYIVSRINNTTSVIRTIVIFSIIFYLIALFSPGLLSSDVYSYTSYGRLSSIYGINPYVFPPSYVPNDIILAWNPWKDTVSVYGPLWATISYFIVRLLFGFETELAPIIFRFVAFISQIGTLFLVFNLLNRVGHKLNTFRVTTPSAVALLWNPIIIIEGVMNGHNESLIQFFIVFGIFLIITSMCTDIYKDVTLGFGMITLICSFLVKIVIFPLIVMITVSLIIKHRSLHLKYKTLSSIILVNLLVIILISYPWIDMRAVSNFLTFVDNGGQRHMNAVSDLFVADLASFLVARIRFDPTTARDVAQVGLRVAGLSVFTGYVCWAVIDVARRNLTAGELMRRVSMHAAVTLSILQVLVLTQEMAWYWMWPLALVLFVGPGTHIRDTIVGWSVLFLPVFYLRHYSVGPESLLIWYLVIPVVWVFVARPAFGLAVLRGKAAFRQMAAV